MKKKYEMPEMDVLDIQPTGFLASSLYDEMVPDGTPGASRGLDELDIIDFLI